MFDCAAFLWTAVLLLLLLFFAHGTTLWHKPSRRNLYDGDGFGEHVRKIVSSWLQEKVSASQEHIDSVTSDGALERVSHVT